MGGEGCLRQMCVECELQRTWPSASATGTINTFHLLLSASRLLHWTFLDSLPQKLIARCRMPESCSVAPSPAS